MFNAELWQAIDTSAFKAVYGPQVAAQETAYWRSTADHMRGLCLAFAAWAKHYGGISGMPGSLVRLLLRTQSILDHLGHCGKPTVTRTMFLSYDGNILFTVDEHSRVVPVPNPAATIAMGHIMEVIIRYIDRYPRFTWF